MRCGPQHPSSLASHANRLMACKQEFAYTQWVRQCTWKNTSELNRLSLTQLVERLPTHCCLGREGAHMLAHGSAQKRYMTVFVTQHGSGAEAASAACDAVSLTHAPESVVCSFLFLVVVLTLLPT